jgi:hypothetical protein
MARLFCFAVGLSHQGLLPRKLWPTKAAVRTSGIPLGSGKGLTDCGCSLMIRIYAFILMAGCQVTPVSGETNT